MKINYDENCDFGGAFEGAYIEYSTSTGNTYHCGVHSPFGLIYWWNRIVAANYKIVGIKNFDAKKLFKWAGIYDYPECMSRYLQNTRKV